MIIRQALITGISTILVMAIGLSSVMASSDTLKPRKNCRDIPDKNERMMCKRGISWDKWSELCKVINVNGTATDEQIYLRLDAFFSFAGWVKGKKLAAAIDQVVADPKILDQYSVIVAAASGKAKGDCCATCNAPSPNCQKGCAETYAGDDEGKQDCIGDCVFSAHMCRCGCGECGESCPQP